MFSTQHFTMRLDCRYFSQLKLYRNCQEKKKLNSFSVQKIKTVIILFHNFYLIVNSLLVQQFWALLISKLTVNLSHMGAFALSVTLLLHLGLHLGNHLLHSSQLCKAKKHWRIKSSDTKRGPCWHPGLQSVSLTSASFSCRIISLSISSGSGPFLFR